MNLRPAGWYWRRLRRFERGELLWRITDAARRESWLRRADTRPTPARPVLAGAGHAAFAPQARSRLSSEIVARLVNAADELLQGRWTVLGIDRHDLVDPDWDGDGRPETVRLVDLDGTESSCSSLKHTWELSRHHVLTVLAAATWVTGDPRYAERAAALLESWIDGHAQPRSNVHWASVEIAERLISWAWLRRLAGDIGAVRDVIESEPARRSIAQHVDWLVRFPSRYSSANNHRLAEAAGAVVGSLAFADLVSMPGAAATALERLHQTLAEQVSPSGLQREPAVDYHCFVFDLAVVALAEAAAHGHTTPVATVERLTRMADALALISCADGVSSARFGDSDESQVAQVDGPGTSAVERALSLAGVAVGESQGWPAVQPTVRATMVGFLAATALARENEEPTTDVERLARDGYVALLRTGEKDAQRVDVAMRVGPFAYRSIGSHSHADLLALDVRLEGVALIADPGTSAYGELPGWRRQERSTASHSTLAVAGLDQVEYVGPFLWGGDASAVVIECRRAEALGGRVTGWTARHDAYRRRGVAGDFVRSVDLIDGGLLVCDRIDASVGGAGLIDVEMCWQFGPGWTREGTGDDVIELHGFDRVVRVALAQRLQWSVGSAASGWGDSVSSGFGRRISALTVRGRGLVRCGEALFTRFGWQRLS